MHHIRVVPLETAANNHASPRRPSSPGRVTPEPSELLRICWRFVQNYRFTFVLVIIIWPLELPGGHFLVPGGQFPPLPTAPWVPCTGAFRARFASAPSSRPKRPHTLAMRRSRKRKRRAEVSELRGQFTNYTYIVDGQCVMCSVPWRRRTTG